MFNLSPHLNHETFEEPTKMTRPALHTQHSTVSLEQRASRHTAVATTIATNANTTSEQNDNTKASDCESQSSGTRPYEFVPKLQPNARVNAKIISPFTEMLENSVFERNDFVAYLKYEVSDNFDIQFWSF